VPCVHGVVLCACDEGLGLCHVCVASSSDFNCHIASPKFGGLCRERYIGDSEVVQATGSGALGRAFSRPCASEWERAIAVGGKKVSSIALIVRSSRRETDNFACGR
jgi:hypothetical protein